MKRFLCLVGFIALFTACSHTPSAASNPLSTKPQVRRTMDERVIDRDATHFLHQHG